ncbi:1204_t:CDS:10 [Entrophospora sp. SA101]|nr:1000_t:CDS:10 [Entrophospora sp. SA101]CAJ0746652.1 1204_t:CDS:10 [Entrophospora sp. SA101]
MNSQKEENIHLAYKKKLPSQFMEFCQKESTASLKCLDVNNYDRTKCQEYFSMYRESDNPGVYFDATSKLLITGQYDGISEYDVIGQKESYDVSTASFIIQLANNNTYKLAGSTSTQGTINALCILPRSSDNNDNADVDVFIGGNFTSIGGITTNNIIRYDVTTDTFLSLLDGLDGAVHSLYCDKSNSIVYVGGLFSAPVNPTKNNYNATEFGSGVAIWNNGTGIWQPLPFKGFNGPVYTIASNKENNTIYFGGSFDATGDGQFGVSTGSQPINMRNATISGGNNAVDYTVGNPSAIICSADLDGPGNIWLLRDNIPGYWRAEYPVKLSPTFIGLKNTNFQGRGTKKLIATADNSVVDLKYVDPNNGTQMICRECTLTQNNQDFQMFEFVASKVLTGIQIDILEWYGGGGGLHGIQLFQNDIIVNAVNDRDSFSCSSAPFVPQVKTIGNWVPSLLSGIWENVLQTTIKATDLTTSDAKITLIPYVPQAGNYKVTIATLTCLPFGCDKAASVDITITVAPGVSQNITISQNTRFSKEDLIYEGFVLQTSNNFQPTVEITLSKTTPPVGGGDVLIIADFVKFVKTNNGAPLSSLLLYIPQSDQNPQALWDGFNGLLAPRSVVHDIVVLEQSSLVIGGYFDNAASNNIVKYDGSTFNPLSNKGLNGPVRTIEKVGNSLLVGGLFSNTSDNQIIGLNNLAKYDLTENKWSSLSGGVNGGVERIALVNQDGSSRQVHVAGKFNTLISPNSQVNGNVTFGYAIWDDDNSKWLQNGFIDGSIGDIVSLNSSSKSDSMTFIAGNIYSAQSTTAYGASLLLGHNDFVAFPMYPQVTNGSKSEIIINTGSLWNDKKSDNTYVIIGGSFDLQDQNITNLAISKNNVLMPSNFTIKEEVKSLVVVEEGSLFIGGAFNFTGPPQNIQEFRGFTAYELIRNALNDNQPPRLSAGDNVVKVNSIKSRLGTNNIIVAGKFDKAGSIDCVSICSWDYKIGEWKSIVSNSVISGEITSVDFIENIKLDGNAINLLQYDFKATNWVDIGSNLPGPASSVAYDSSASDNYFISGYDNNNQTYIRKWDGAQFTDVLINEILAGSLINSLRLLPSNVSHYSNQILDKYWLLLISGTLNLQNYGIVNAALFDGENIYPFIIASKENGIPGTINSIFTIIDPGLLNERKVLPLPIVIIISVAISFALVFLIVFIGMSIVYLKRKKMAKELPSSSDRHRNISDKHFIRDKTLKIMRDLSSI